MALRTLLITLVAVTSTANLVAQPPAGSQLPLDENTCATCHGEADLWEGDTARLHVPHEGLAEDIHWLKGVNCHDCHGGDPSSFDTPDAHSMEVGEEAEGVLPFRMPLGDVWRSCATCHKDQAIGVVKGVHAKAGERDDQGRGTPLRCKSCHGDTAHGILPLDDPRSPVFLDHQVQTCGACHDEYLETWTRSVHGNGLYNSGLAVTASCADCHGAHGIHYASDDRSTLHPTRVAGTCGKCHRFIEERLQKSVHGRNGTGTKGERVAPGGKEKRSPSCTDCHQGHDLPHPDSVAFRLQLPNRCGNCHADLSHRYAMSMHGELTELGYGPAAKCSDCHGAHDILPISNPDSHLSSANRLQACKACHIHASGNFLNFDPHADHTDAEKNPILNKVYVTLLALIVTVFSLFGLHSILWFVRSLVQVLKHGRPRAMVPGAGAYLRFGKFHRVAHIFLLVSFLGLALTGLPLKYSQHDWAKFLAFAFGGFESTSIWHRIFGLVNFGCLAVYVVRMSRRLVTGYTSGCGPRSLIFGPDSPVPNWRDVKDFFRMIRWFFGLGPKPTFERWSYWEKFDFWGANADIVIIGLTGLVLWFPNLFCAFLPGQTLNLAKVIHSTQALLATGFVFAIHFFNTHFRAEKFPMDMSILTGLVSEEEFQEERPEYLERMRREGKLDELRAAVPSKRKLRMIRLGGLLGLLLGLGLLAGMIVAGIGG